MALKMGIPADRFWDMSLREILDEVDAATRREQRRQQELLEELRAQAGLLYRAAQLVAIATWNGKRYPSFEKAFPGLAGAKEDGETPVPQWKRQQAGMAAWVQAYNTKVRKRKEAEEDGSTG